MSSRILIFAHCGRSLLNDHLQRVAGLARGAGDELDRLRDDRERVAGDRDHAQDREARSDELALEELADRVADVGDDEEAAGDVPGEPGDRVAVAEAEQLAAGRPEHEVAGVVPAAQDLRRHERVEAAVAVEVLLPVAVAVAVGVDRRRIGAELELVEVAEPVAVRLVRAGARASVRLGGVVDAVALGVRVARVREDRVEEDVALLEALVDVDLVAVVEPVAVGVLDARVGGEDEVERRAVVDALLLLAVGQAVLVRVLAVVRSRRRSRGRRRGGRRRSRRGSTGRRSRGDRPQQRLVDAGAEPDRVDRDPLRRPRRRSGSGPTSRRRR